MRNFLLVMVILMRMQHVEAQVACPVSPAVDFWSGLTTTSSLVFSTYSNSVEISGTLEVNTPLFTFDGADVGFKAFNSKIVVNPSCTLRIINASTLTNLDAFNRWQGIDVLPGGRLEVNGSEICGAENAILCNNAFSAVAGEFDVRNSFLRFNVAGIKVSDYSTGPYPGIVYNTHFLGGAMPSMFPPYSVHGVSAESVDPLSGTGLRIGDPALTSTPNRFTELAYGIQAFNTTLEVFNNEFEAIQDLVGVGAAGYAVYAADRSPGSYYLGVGMGLLVPNTMKDCLFGVYVTGYDSVRINNNTMTAPADSFRTGITVERVRLIISVLNNEIRQFGKLGVLLNDNPGLGGGTALDAAVSDNLIRGENLKTKGVFVDELVGDITIKTNEIDRVWRGIGIQSSDGDFNIRENTVDFRYPGASVTTEPAAGIYVLSSQEALLLRNQVSGNCPSPAGGGPCNTYTVANARIRGIQLNQTINTEVYNNDIQYAGAGVYVQGPNVEGNMVCNNFFDNYSAVVWDNLPTDGFGVTGPGALPNRVYGLTSGTAWSENTFVSSVTGFEPFRSWSINSADAGSVDWYYQNAPTFDFPVGTISLVGGPPTSLLAPTVGTSTLVCDALRLVETIEEFPGFIAPESSEGDNLFNNLVRVRATAASLDELYPQLLAWFRMDLSGTALDSMLDLTTIRELEEVQSLWLAGNLDGLEEQLAGLNPVLPQENSLKRVWEIQLAAAQTGNNTLGTTSFAFDSFIPPTDLEILQAIALDTVTNHAQAIYKAQSLLGWSLLEDRWLLNEEESRIAAQAENIGPIKLFPNPAESSATIQSDQPIATIRLYNLNGKIVEEAFAYGSMKISLDLKTLAIGEYLVTIILEAGGVSTMKLIVQ